MKTHRMDELLLDLYECPVNRARWPQVLDRVCRATGARSAVIQVLESEGEHAWSRWTLRDSASEEASVEHEKYMGDDVNPRMCKTPYALSPTEPPVVRDSYFFAPGDPALIEVQDRLAAIGLGHFMSVGEALPGEARLSLILHKGLRDRRDFDSDEVSFALGLLPHLRQALQLTEHIERSREQVEHLEGAINRVRCALLLCDSDARVLWANSTAQNVLTNGNSLRVCADRLSTSSSQETGTLRQRISQVAQQETVQPADRYLVLGRNGTAELQVMMHPVSGREMLPLSSRSTQKRGLRRVLLVVSNPGNVPTLPAELIGRVFALSPAESRVAAALFTGLTINEYASATGVTIGTARFQLKQVLAKTNVSRQADLIRQICSSVIAQALPTNGDD